jgi:hypothetical protein
MPVAQIFNSLPARRGRTGARLRLALMVGLLMGCSTASQPPAGSPAISQELRVVERCSTLGAAACRAMALLSSDAASTCTVSMSRDGRRTEMCGAVPATANAAVPVPVQPTTAIYPVQVAWSDNSNDESHFVIERCDRIVAAAGRAGKVPSCAGSWTQIATVGANTTSYVDRTAKVNQTYIYRIKAVNSAGSSGYTEEAAITTPSR